MLLYEILFLILFLILLKENNELYGFGNNDFNQLCLGNHQSAQNPSASEMVCCFFQFFLKISKLFTKKNERLLSQQELNSLIPQKGRLLIFPVVLCLHIF